MVRVPDVTAVVPQRRMGVARGRIAAARDVGADALAAAKAAACLAAKDAARLVPTMPPLQLTDAFCDLAQDGAEWACTVTVQGFGRAPFGTAAMAGVCAALLSLAETSGAGNAVIREVLVVQDVVG